jgi:hypothetical protein
MLKEMAPVTGNSGPPLSPMKCWPATVKSTVSTAPSGVLGLSAAAR